MLTKEDLDMKHLKWVLILGTLAVVLIAGSFFVGNLIAGAAAATVVGVMRFLGFLCIAAYGVVRYML